MLSYGTLSTTAKKAINDVGRHKAIVCSYAVLVVLAMVAALFLGVRFNLPPELILPFIAQIAIGGLGIIATYKALHHGKASLTAPIAKSHTLIVLMTGILLSVTVRIL